MSRMDHRLVADTRPSMSILRASASAGAQIRRRIMPALLPAQGTCASHQVASLPAHRSNTACKCITVTRGCAT